MRTLYVHIGFHKTGTSSIQSVCRSNKCTLENSGILYPKTGLSSLILKSTLSSEAGHRALKPLFSNPQGLKAKYLFQQLKKEVFEKNLSKTIISSETFSSPKMFVSAEAKPLLKEIFEKIYVIAYVRRQEHWMDSFYRETLCWPRRREVRSFEEFCEEEGPSLLNYEERISKWDDVFGATNIVLKNYDTAKSSILSSFLNILGNEDLSACLPEKRGNPSLPYNLVNRMIEVNRKNISSLEKSEFTQELFQNILNSNRRIECDTLTSIYLKKNKITFDRQNEILSERYNIDEREGFVSLDVKQRVREPVLADDDKSFESIISKMGANSCSWGVCTYLPIDTKLEQVNWFCAYHASLGCSNILIFTEKNVKITKLPNTVSLIECDEEFWVKNKLGSDSEIQQKGKVVQRIGHQRLAKKFGLSWSIYLDINELLWNNSVLPISRELNFLCSGKSLLSLETLSVLNQKLDRRLFLNGNIFPLQRPNSLISFIDFLVKTKCRQFVLSGIKRLRLDKTGYIKLGSLTHPKPNIDIFLPLFRNQFFMWLRAGKPSKKYEVMASQANNTSRRYFLMHSYEENFDRNVQELRLNQSTINGHLCVLSFNEKHDIQGVNIPIILDKKNDVLLSEENLRTLRKNFLVSKIDRSTQKLILRACAYDSIK